MIHWMTPCNGALSPRNTQLQSALVLRLQFQRYYPSHQMPKTRAVLCSLRILIVILSPLVDGHRSDLQLLPTACRLTAHETRSYRLALAEHLGRKIECLDDRNMDWLTFL